MARPAGIEPATVGLEIGAAESERATSSEVTAATAGAPANGSALDRAGAPLLEGQVRLLGDLLRAIPAEDRERLVEHVAAIAAMSAKRRRAILDLTDEAP